MFAVSVIVVVGLFMAFLWGSNKMLSTSLKAAAKVFVFGVGVALVFSATLHGLIIGALIVLGVIMFSSKPKKEKI